MNQPNLLALLGLAVGIVLADKWTGPLWWAGAGLGLVVLACYKKWRETLIVLIALTTGFLYWGMRAPESPPSMRVQPQTEITGVVLDYPRITSERTSFDLRCEEAPRGVKKVRVVGYFSTRIDRGDILHIRGQLKEVREPGNPGEFDYRRFLARRGIYYTLTVKKPEHIQVLGEDRSWWQQLVVLSREKGMAAIEETLPAHEAALLKGMVLGESSGIDPEEYRDFQKTGLAHILAVSGLNVGFVMLLAVWLAALLRITGRGRLVLAAAFVFVYGCLAGWPVSLLRAALMAWLGLLAYYAGREKNPVNALAVAGTLMLIINPGWLFEISFQLSFLATWGLVYLFPVLREKLPGTGWLKDLILIPLTAQITTLPVIIYYFNLLSLSSLVANILGTYLVGAAIILGLCGLLVGMVSVSLAGVFLLPAGLATGLIIVITSWLAKLPGSCLWVAQPSGWAVALFYAGVVSLVKGLTGFSRRQVIAGSAIISFFLVLVLIPAGWKDRGRLHVTFLDVGQGDAVLIKTPQGRFVLVDGGGSRFWDVGNRVVLPLLQRQGIRKLDLLVVTHPDIDHIGGVIPVLNEMPVSYLGVSNTTYPGAAYREIDRIRSEQGLPIIELSRGHRINLEPGLTLEILHPPKEARQAGQDSGESSNNDSVVMRVGYGRISFLLTGDIEREVMDELVEEGMVEKSTVVKVPHHGSRGSLSPAFYEAASPQMAVVSVGETNIFGHPAPETLDLLHEINIKIYRTDHQGAITLVTDGQDLWVRTVKTAQGSRL